MATRTAAPDRHGRLPGAVAGLYHAHLGWIFSGGRAAKERYARDLIDDPIARFVDRTAGAWVLLGMALRSAPAGRSAERSRRR